MVEDHQLTMFQIVGHGVAGGTVLGTLFGWLPPLAALLGCIWYLIQICESRSFRRFVSWIVEHLRQS
jgi:hypothetical protein